MLIRKLFRTAWNYKAQFISMIIMLAIGTGIFFGFNIEWKSIEYDVQIFFDETLYADYRIYSESGFTKEEIDKIKEIDGIDEATRYLSVNTSVKDTKNTIILNVSEDYNVSTMYITDGEKYDSDIDGIWLSDKYANANNLKIGDNITLTYANLEISAEVVGLAKSSENMVCVADDNQLMPDYDKIGFGYISPSKLEKELGTDFYTQINIISDMTRDELEKKVKEAVGTTLLVADKDIHTSYAAAQSEIEEGKTMGQILPVLFLLIAVLTMITTMHRITSNEKTQIGTLKALGMRDKKILFHYTSYGALIGVFGIVLGVVLGYTVAYVIFNPDGSMGTYFDMPYWNLVMPRFCIPVMILILMCLILISFLSTRQMLKGTAADSLRPYTPKKMKKSIIEALPFCDKLSFEIKWNLRDVFYHKSRSAMTLIGVCGCMILLVAGFGMSDSMKYFINMLDEDINKYETKINLTEDSSNEEALTLADELAADWQSSMGISFGSETITLEIYNAKNDRIGFVTEENESFILKDSGVYLSLRLKELADVGDTIEFSPYGTDKTYKVRVEGYFRSPISECMVMSAEYADSIGIEYHISTIYTDKTADDIETSSIISSTQEKKVIMDTYDVFMNIMNLMISILAAASIILGIVVLYNLGVLSYLERYRELATLKVLGFKDREIGTLLISQNVWITVVGMFLGIPGGYFVLDVLVNALVSEYELSVIVNVLSYVVSVAITFGVSLVVGFMLAGKNKKINMVEALKNAE